MNKKIPVQPKAENKRPEVKKMSASLIKGDVGDKKLQEIIKRLKI